MKLITFLILSSLCTEIRRGRIVARLGLFSFFFLLKYGFPDRSLNYQNASLDHLLPLPNTPVTARIMTRSRANVIMVIM